MRAPDLGSMFRSPDLCRDLAAVIESTPLPDAGSDDTFPQLLDSSHHIDRVTGLHRVINTLWNSCDGIMPILEDELADIVTECLEYSTTTSFRQDCDRIPGRMWKRMAPQAHSFTTGIDAGFLRQLPFEFPVGDSDFHISLMRAKNRRCEYLVATVSADECTAAAFKSVAAEIESTLNSILRTLDLAFHFAPDERTVNPGHPDYIEAPPDSPVHSIRASQIQYVWRPDQTGLSDAQAFLELRWRSDSVLIPLDQRLKSALQILSLADKSDHPGASMSLHFSAIESLLKKEEERGPISKTLSRRCATLLHMNPNDRQSASARYIDMWNKRCEFVHRGDTKQAPDDSERSRQLAAGVQKGVVEWYKFYRTRLESGIDQAEESLIAELDEAYAKERAIDGLPNTLSRCL